MHFVLIFPTLRLCVDGYLFALLGCAPSDPNVTAGLLDIDGLPPIGRYIEHEQPYYR